MLCTVSKIKQMAHIPKGTSITYILEDIWDCKVKGIKYKGVMLHNQTGCKPIIAIEGIETQIIADCLESGQSQRQMLELVNPHRAENAPPPISNFVITCIINKLKPKICTTVRKKQGSHDPNSKWSWARLNWVKHLLICFGHLPSQPDPTTNLIPSWFNAELMPKLDLS